MRRAGILLHISSLPSPYGIGSLGQAALDFVDFLLRSGIGCWQILPLGPTGYGNSPYQCYSSFAGNPLFIDLDRLAEAGLLDGAGLAAWDWGSSPCRVEYEKVAAGREHFLRKAFDAFDMAETRAFCRKNAAWLPDYALFMAAKRHFEGKPWMEWEEPLRLRRSRAVAHYTKLLQREIEYEIFLQYMFFSQWEQVHAYAAERGVRILGDIPFYVALDSADVWACPGQFLLDKRLAPTHVAGVPPDYFSATGQLWGNPLYNWRAMKMDGYAWWMARLAAATSLFDLVRIDHFRAFDAYWAIPAGAETAESGKWEQGPGMTLVGRMGARYAGRIIAEDLGILTDSVRALLASSRFPGMKVLQFAFNSPEPSEYLPHRCVENCVYYTGTHDNDTLLGWLEGGASEWSRAYARDYLGLNAEEGWCGGCIRAVLASPAQLAIFQMQDVLEQRSDCRMNTPSTVGANWEYRVEAHLLCDGLAAKIRRWAEVTHRLNDTVPPQPELEEAEEQEAAN